MVTKTVNRIESKTKKITLYKADICRGSLILVNRENPIKHRNDIRLVIVDEKHSDILLENNAANMLWQLLSTVGNSNEIVPVSGFCNRKEQEEIYNTSLIENGRQFTEKYVAVPNCSEHQTGLAIDLGQYSEKIDFIRPDFPYTGICGAFRSKAAQYGFIERYEKGKETITGISHEPWHFRYVGYPHSEIMKIKNLSLEEYIEFTKGFKYGDKHICIEKDSKLVDYCSGMLAQSYGAAYSDMSNKIEIFYLDSSNNEATIEVPENDLCQISGNNVDGFIVTLWRQGHRYETSKAV